MATLHTTTGTATRAPPHAVLFPAMFLGQIRPALQLARRLAYVHGFKVTVVTTSHIYEKLGLAHATNVEDNLQYIDLGERIIPESYYGTDALKVLVGAHTALGPAVKELLATIHESILPITCVISDVLFNEPHKMALHYGFPSVAFSLCALALSSKYYGQRLVAEGLLPLPKNDPERKQMLSKVVTAVPGMYPMALGEYHTALLVDDLEDANFKDVTVEHPASLHERDWILSNTVHELEVEVIDAMEQDSGIKLLSVGPLAIAPMTLNGSFRVDDDDNSTTSFWPEETERIMDWLATQSPVSVVYVSFGSIASWAPSVLEEILLGLEASQVPFLLVMRPDLSQSLGAVFKGIQERTKGRALVVGWAPQLRVLGHIAIAAFLTHCGWNSTVEGISSGVPMLCYPCFFDQLMNSRFIVSVWKVGLLLEKRADGSVDRAEVVTKVRAIVAKDSDLRASANAWKDVIRRAVQQGGSSHNNMLDFVADMYKRAQDSNVAKAIRN